MELDDQWMFARFQILGNKDADFDLVIPNSFIGYTVDVEAVEAGSRCCIVKRSHIWSLLARCR
jgi:hypothetical protein